VNSAVGEKREQIKEKSGLGENREKIIGIREKIPYLWVE